MFEGDANFYTDLGSVGWTESLRWDHQQFLLSASAPARVIDLAGGNDVFLTAAAAANLDCTSVDFAGLDARPKPARSSSRLEFDLSANGQRAEVLKLLGQNADYVTAFQILEHLGDPVEFASFARCLLKPGGTLVLSVPNRDRFDLSTNQALDCPPHHQTRWGIKQLRLLGQILGASQVNVQREIRLHPKVILGGPPYWLWHKARRSSPSFGAVGRPWPPHHVPQGHCVLGFYRF